MKFIKPVELFLATAGVLALFVGLFADLGIVTATLLLTAIIIISVIVSIVARRYYKYQILTAKDEIGVFRTPLEYDFDQIYLLDRSVFPDADLIPKETFIQWFRVNKKTFTVLHVGENLIGYYSVLPLKQSTFRKFLKGSISEIDFTSKDILSEQEAQSSKEIYFFSTVIDKGHRERGFQLLQHLLDELKTKTTYPRVQKIYAAAATSDGRRLLQKLGFLKIADAAERKDHHDLYEYSYSTQASA